MGKKKKNEEGRIARNEGGKAKGKEDSKEMGNSQENAAAVLICTSILYTHLKTEKD